MNIVTESRPQDSPEAGSQDGVRDAIGGTTGWHGPAKPGRGAFSDIGRNNSTACEVPVNRHFADRATHRKRRGAYSRTVI